MPGTVADRTPKPATAALRRLPPQPCPACGMPSAVALAALPSGLLVRVEACAICGRQEALPLAPGCIEQPGTARNPIPATGPRKAAALSVQQ